MAQVQANGVAYRGGEYNEGGSGMTTVELMGANE